MLFHQLEDNLWCTKRRKQFGHFCEHNLALSSFLWLNMSIVAEQHCLTINVCSSLFQQHCSALMKHQRFNVPSTVQYSTVQHSTVQYNAVQHSTVQNLVSLSSSIPPKCIIPVKSGFYPKLVT